MTDQVRLWTAIREQKVAGREKVCMQSIGKTTSSPPPSPTHTHIHTRIATNMLRTALYATETTNVSHALMIAASNSFSDERVIES